MRSLYRSKRATFNVLLAVVVTLIVGLLLLIIGYQINKKTSAINDDQKCSMSILANDQLSKMKKSSYGAMGSTIGFECPRREVLIEAEDVEKYGRINDDRFKTIIAEEMKSCWIKTGGGKMDPFKTGGWADVEESYCLVCREMRFDSSLVKAAKDQNYHAKGFQYWIATHSLPGIKTTLYEKIKKEQPSQETLAKLKETENSDMSSFNFDNKYVVIWRVEKYEESRLWSWAKWVGIGALAVGGVVFLPIGLAAVGVGGAAAVASGSLAVVSAVGGAKAVLGVAIGIGISSEDDDNNYVSQQIFIIPEKTLSTEFDFANDGKKKDFCTQMIN
ncbi:hypothetical protein ACFL3V_07115 [Nanoarchaeota archaeon]